MSHPHINNDDKFHEECGVFGIFNADDAATLTLLGLHALQHRGQESAGIVTYDDKTQEFYAHRGLGLVSDVFSDPLILPKLLGDYAVGHNRYATTGALSHRNIQPLFAEFAFGGLAVAHNGNLTNTETLRKALIEKGCLFQSTSDTEIFIQLIAISRKDTVEDRLIDALKQVKGAYSLVALSSQALIAARDPDGVRPLVLGKQVVGEGKERKEKWIVASETCALDILDAHYVRDVEPGEIIIITHQGIRTLNPFKKDVQPRFCIFEYIYFARPDSIISKRPVYAVRQNIGKELAKESPADADIVVPVPDSGVPSAIGYAQQSQLPFELGIIRSHYVGRTFIQPTDRIRHLHVRMKHSPNRYILKGKRIVLIDDSIVRGTTSRKIITMLRAAGATEIHMRIASPPIHHPCFYGIDTPHADQLLAARHNLTEMTKMLNLDSLAFISIDGLYRAVSDTSTIDERKTQSKRPFCDACFTGHYPIELVDQENHHTS